MDRPSRFLEPGDHLVDSTVVCVLTRFRLRRPWHLVQTYLGYRRMMRKMARAAPDGFLKASFLVEGPTTCYSLSLWADERAIAMFSTTIPEHVPAANRVFGRLRFLDDGPEIWSTKWHLSRVSNNLRWSGFDMWRTIVEQEASSR
jgi:hypothetical protein